ncbi:MAG: phospholipid carrier-dependent glycosyltransferase [Phycisphaerae bacterium]|nr:glycosyltransferase family 39 protein [Phycisphaerae bacterium]NIP53237.1 glycosyltransferase family 39 protein [Phycisphaerae bacterium]NIS52263.1 glycosyltransferase family 39 protein [Phycisphaerae bacterium]NIU09809.1 glycosyltransferase family 39 protein [Phycisphaerae bacterium]NIU59447.1 phospholipid carrier-dependent glycosyltransferase [Phycisphaerae bacterium]
MKRKKLKTRRAKTIHVSTPFLPKWRKTELWLLLSIVAISFVLNSIGLDWGRTGFVPWQADSIEGITTIRENSRLFKEWTYKYPRGQFLINAIFYKPYLDKWKKNPVPTKTRDGKPTWSVLNQSRLDKLAHISRIIVMLMGVGTIIAVFMTARILFNNYLSAVFSSLALAFSNLFVFYSHVGNVDVPCIFWFAWGTYFAVKSIHVGKWFHFAFMGFCFSFSMCTKDAMVGYVIGMIPAYWFLSTYKAKNEGKNLKEAVRAVFSKKLIIAVVVFLFSYALLQNVLTSPDAFAQRMSHWIGGPGVTNFNKGFQGQLPLFWKSCRELYTSLGWPFLLTAIASLLYSIIKKPWIVGFALIPLLAFYFIVVINVKMTCPRYFLPGFIGIALIIGYGNSVFWKIKKNLRPVVIILILTAYILSLLYCVGLDLEMADDPRKQTEKWFAKNVSRDKIIVGPIPRNDSPRLNFQGFRFISQWHVKQKNGTYFFRQAHPDYIITSKYRSLKNPVTKSFQNALEAEKLNYSLVADFRNKYLYTSKITPFNLAGWPRNRFGWINEQIKVFTKTTKL